MPVQKTKKLIIVGDSAFAEVAYECFTHDSPYEVVAFCVEREYLRRSSLFELPVLPLEEIEAHVGAGEAEFYVATVYTQLNRLRTRLFHAMKAKGYSAASYVSSRASVWRNVTLGEHCFVFEDNTIQPFVTIGENVVLWSGNHVGHHSVVEDNCFIASHAVISGFCRIGRNSFIGVNATIANNVEIGADNWIGLGVTIARSTVADQLFKGPRHEASEKPATEYFKVPAR